MQEKTNLSLSTALYDIYTPKYDIARQKKANSPKHDKLKHTHTHIYINQLVRVQMKQWNAEKHKWKLTEKKVERSSSGSASVTVNACLNNRNPINYQCTRRKISEPDVMKGTQISM